MDAAFQDMARRTPRKARRAPDYANIVRTEHQPLNLLDRPSARMLIQLAARRWNVCAELLTGESRDTLVVVARHHAMWLIRTHTKLSLPQIGRIFGGRDHTTVLYGIRQHLKRVAGREPIPFVWTAASVRNVLRFVRGGSTLQEAAQTFGMSHIDLWRHPHYPELRQLAREHLSDRLARRAFDGRRGRA